MNCLSPIFWYSFLKFIICELRKHPYPFETRRILDYEIWICSHCGLEWVMEQGTLIPLPQHADCERIWDMLE